MGNIVQCCRVLSNYLKCTDAPEQHQPEISPLLSSEESECDSLSLLDGPDEDLSTVSTAVSNPTLEPENFLFPDIVLSSNLSGGVTLVEPMVCLLVSEEDERVTVDELGGRAPGRISKGRNRESSEVETQTEVETRIGTGVQTQAESPAQIGIETVEREGNAVDVLEEQVLLETQTDAQRKLSENDSETGSDTAVVFQAEVLEDGGKPAGKNKQKLVDTDQEADRGELSRMDVGEEPAVALTEASCPTEQHADMEQNICEESISEAPQNADATRSELTDQEASKVTERTSGEGSRRSGQPIETSVCGTMQKLDPAEDGMKSNGDHEQNANDSLCQDSLHPAMGEDGKVLELDTALPQGDEEEEVAGKKEATLFPVDKLFWASLNVRGEGFY